MLASFMGDFIGLILVIGVTWIVVKEAKKRGLLILFLLASVVAFSQPFEGEIIGFKRIVEIEYSGGEKIITTGSVTIIKNDCKTEILVSAVNWGSRSLEVVDEVKQSEGSLYITKALCNSDNGYNAYDEKSEIKINNKEMIVFACGGLIKFKFYQEPFKRGDR